jgi:hypothetical protein
MPVLKLRESGNTDRFSSNGERAVHTMPDGKVLVLLADKNLSTAQYGAKDGVHRWYIYECDLTARTTTLKLSGTFPTAATSTYGLQCAVFPNGTDLGITFETADFLGFRYAKYTYATNTMSAWDAAVSGSTTRHNHDIAVTDNGNVIVPAIHRTTTGNSAVYLQVKRNDGTWVTTINVGPAPILLPTFWNTASHVKVVPLGSPSANLRRVILLIQMQGKNSAGNYVQNGNKLYYGVINESTGAVTTAFTEIGSVGNSAFTNKYTAFETRFLLARNAEHGFAAAFQDLKSNRQTVLRSFTHSGTLVQTSYANYGGNDTYFGTAQSVVPRWGFSIQSNSDPRSMITFMGRVSDDAGAEANRSAIMQWYKTLDNNVMGRYSGYRPEALIDVDGNMNELGNLYGCTDTSQDQWRPAAATVKGKHVTCGMNQEGVFWISWTEPDNQFNQNTKSQGVAGSAIQAFTPAVGSNFQTATPTVSWVYDNNVRYTPSPYRMEFQVADDSGFTTNVKTFKTGHPSPAQNMDSSDGVTVSANWDPLLPITAGVRYVRCRMIDAVDNVGPWKAGQQFTIGHPPTGIPLSPNDIMIGESVDDNYTFTWGFADPFEGDHQTAYQFRLYNDVGAVVADSGKITSTVQSHTQNIVFSTSPTNYTWSIQLWDMDNVAGLESDKLPFALAAQMSLVIGTPAADGATVTSGQPTFTFTPTDPSGGQFYSYVLTISRGGDTVYSSGEVAGTYNSGVAINHVLPGTILQNGLSYTAQITVTAVLGNLKATAIRTFVTAWTPPASVSLLTVDPATYSSDGYVTLTWNDTARDANFVRYHLYRAVGTLTGDWSQYELIYTEYGLDTTYEYHDYSAPSGVLVSYVLRQVASTGTWTRESENTTPISVSTSADGYWLIDPNGNGPASPVGYKLSIITGDSYTDEQEEEEYKVIGRGRMFNKGDHLGIKGTLDCQVRDNPTRTARQMKQVLEDLQKLNRALQLRTPFGDTYNVNVSSMNISRVAGVGTAEFVDVQIPYSEVSE